MMDIFACVLINTKTKNQHLELKRCNNFIPMHMSFRIAKANEMLWVTIMFLLETYKTINIFYLAAGNYF